MVVKADFQLFQKNWSNGQERN